MPNVTFPLKSNAGTLEIYVAVFDEQGVYDPGPNGYARPGDPWNRYWPREVFKKKRTTHGISLPRNGSQIGVWSIVVANVRLELSYDLAPYRHGMVSRSRLSFRRCEAVTQTLRRR